MLELLHLVRGVAGLEVVAEPVALHRLRQHDRRTTVAHGGGVVGGVHLGVVVTAALHVPDLVVGHVLDHQLGRGALAEEVVPDVAAGLALVGLEVTVRGLVHDPDEIAGAVAGEERIPLPTPQDLDHVPAGTPEERLQLLHDLAVAAHRTVESLQVAVDHEGQVVQAVVGGQLQQTARLGLVHLAVAEERPHVLVGGVLDAAVAQVAVELGLVDRVHRADAHRHRGELPELRHQPRVRVRRQPVRRLRLLLPEPVQVLLAQPTLEVGAGVHARRGVALEEHLVATARGGRDHGRSGSDRPRRAWPRRRRWRCAHRRRCRNAGPGAPAPRRSSGSGCGSAARSPRCRRTPAPRTRGWC